MSQADLDINRMVRTILVKHWIDLGRMSVRSSGGKLWIHGSLQRIAGVNEQLTAPLVDEMFKEISRIKSIKTVNANLENWNNNLGAWQQTGKAVKEKSEQQTATRSAGVYEIDKETGDK